MGADEALVSDLDPADDELPILDAIAQDMGLRADAAVMADGDEIEHRAERRVDCRIPTDAGAHEPEVKAHQGRPDEHAGPAERLEQVHDPPAQIVEAPNRIAPRLVASDHKPFDRNAQCQQRRPCCEAHNSRRLRARCKRKVGPLQSPRNQQQQHEGHGDRSTERIQGHDLQGYAGPALPGQQAVEHGPAGRTAGLSRPNGNGALYRAALQMRGQPAHRGILVELLHRYAADPEVPPQRRHGLRRQERMSAKIEKEVVVYGNALDREQLAPDLGELLLELVARRYHLAVGAFERRLRRR